MKRIVAFLMLLVVTTQSKAQQPSEKTLLWKIEGKELTSPSYLFGTFHMLCKNDFSISDSLKQVLNSVQELFLEIDIDDPALTTRMMKSISMKDGKKLSDLLPQKDYDTLSKLFKAKTGINVAMVQTYKPFMLISMLYPSMMNCTTVAYEKELANIAQKNKYATKGLETIEDQLNVFEKIPYKKQAKMLLEALTSNNDGEEMQNMVALYKSKDINALYKIIKNSGSTGNYEKVLLKKRNVNWIPVMQQQMQLKSTLFDVGAGHLAGKFGVINLLRKQGYKVSAVMYE
jgi:uncharacterized protein YbaP (TraB family)